MIKQQSLQKNIQKSASSQQQSSQQSAQQSQQPHQSNPRPQIQQQITNQPQQILINKKKTQPIQQLDRKNSHKSKKGNITPTSSNQNGGVKQKIRPLSVKNTQRVNFNLKNNQVEKFYCPQMVMTKVTKAKPIDLNLIPDLPEIPLDSLFDNQ